MSRPWTLVTPASRGIGLALARHLLRTTRAPLVATARRDLDAVRERILQDQPATVDPDRLTVLRLDVHDESTIASAAAHCTRRFEPVPAAHHLRLALLLPGILVPERAVARVDAAAALDTFRTNALGPLLLLKHFAPFLPRRATPLAEAEADAAAAAAAAEGEDESEAAGLPAARAVAAVLSARVGSIADNARGGWYSYRASKAAANQIVRTVDVELARRAGAQAVAVGLHPGTVRTELSREFWASAAKTMLVEPEEAAAMLVDVVRRVGEAERGRCLDYRGAVVPP